MHLRSGLWTLVMMWVLPAVAWGAVDDPQLRLDAELGYACFRRDEIRHGALAGVDTAYLFHPLWSLRLGAAVSEHDADEGRFRVHQIGTGVRFRLDVFEYVPWVELSPTAYITTGGGGPSAFDLGVASGMGLDWLMNEHWVLGVAVRYHRLFGEERFPALVTAGARLGYRWVLGDPFSP